jgi:alpha-tubulin suppressor-like RCC1 family protein
MKKNWFIAIFAALIASSIGITQTNEAPWATFSTSWDHSCTLTKEGKAFCWGSNISGVLGNNSEEQSKVPTPVAGNLLFSSISAGVNHTCAVSQASKVYCWGRNDRAQLGFNGDGSRKPNSVAKLLVPTAVPTDLLFSSVSAGMFHTCALTKEGKAYCWGGNFNGEIGSDFGETETATPLAVKGKLVFTSIYAGRTQSCGLIASSEAYCWGSNRAGQFGDGTTRDQFVPTRAGGEMLYSSLSVGEFHTCGVTKDKKGYCWGRNSSGKLGSGQGTVSETNVPLLVAGNLEFKSISAGSKHSCAVTPTGKAWCWGSGISGQLGIAVAFDESQIPVEVNTKLLFSSIQAANANTCAMAMDKNIYCWGGGTYGKLGNDSTKNSFYPVQVETP